MKTPWTINAKAAGAIEILLYDVIGEDMFGGTSSQAFAQDLKAAGNVNRIHLRVNSPGGEVFEGIGIYNALLSHGAKITAQVDGVAASIASTIIMAASEISISDSGFLMIHNPHTVVRGDSNDMRNVADTLEKVKGTMITAYQRHTKKTKAEVGEIMDEESWFTAEEAVDAGFAERILEPGETVDLAANIDLSRFKNCPQQIAARLAGAGPAASQSVREEERDRQRLRLELLRRLP